MSMHNISLRFFELGREPKRPISPDLDDELKADITMKVYRQSDDTALQYNVVNFKESGNKKSAKKTMKRFDYNRTR